MLIADNYHGSLIFNYALSHDKLDSMLRGVSFELSFRYAKLHFFFISKAFCKVLRTRLGNIYFI